MKTVIMTNGRETLVDDADYPVLSKRRWIMNNKGYAIASNEDYRECGRFMHRIILDAPKGKWVDHIDGNPLNNQRSNLRLCTPKQNHRNRNVSKRSKTGYNGVTKIKTKYSPYKYRAMICVNGKNTHLGLFETAKAASLAYNAAAFQADPEFSRLV